ncbi:MAG: ATP-binding cassette domain-containing protein [Bacteroidetes bacterium]|nr:ATP-binding cassette domain-containing protein [Bacteroidota bacterium]
MSETKDILKKFESGDIKALARIISIVENETDGYEEILSSLKIKNVPVVGITGPPGAGKSTLINAILKKLTDKGKRIGVIAIDPTSPFNYGSLLCDRLRMAEHFTNEKVFIRSLATRGSLGGLSAKTIEVIDVLRAFGSPSLTLPQGKGVARASSPPWGELEGAFDYVFIETVGVGQSEVEIAGLADTTVLVLVPGYGDEVQTLKSGIMEIGDIFVINKSDQPNAEGFAKNVEQLVHSREKSNWTTPVIKAVATEEKGIEEIINKIDEHASHSNDKKLFLVTEKAFKLIRNKRMKDVDKKKLQKEIEKEMKKKDFNLYKFVVKY